MVVKLYLKIFLLFFTLSLGYALSAEAVGANSALAGNTVNKQPGTKAKTTAAFLPQPVIASFTPSSAGKGITVTINGIYFGGATSVSFGGVPAASFTVVSESIITAVPAEGASGSVTVTTPGGTASKAGFKFYPPPTATSFSPAVGGPGSTITINGTNFTDAYKVTFGGANMLGFKVVSATQITVDITANFAAGGDIVVMAPGGNATLPGFIFVPKAVIHASGKTSFTVGGSVVLSCAPSKDYTYQWYKDAVAITGKTDSAITVSDKGDYTVRLTRGNISTLSDAVKVIVSPLATQAITSFQSTTARSGTVITIKGTGLTAASRVLFGNSVPSTSITVKGDTTILATVPVGAGTGSVVVTTPSGDIVAPGTFTYATQPIISSFTGGGTINPGKVITIYGAFFTGATLVKFGLTPAQSYTVVSDSQIDAVVGNGDSGPIGMVTPAGVIISKNSAVYFATPVITSFTPTHGKSGDTIMIHGSGFNSLTAVKFGGVMARSFGSISDTLARAVVNTGATGQLTLTNPGGTATAAQTFTYDGGFLIYGFTPRAGGPQTPVVITGSNFTGTTAVSFGNVPAASFTVNSAGQITALVGAGGASGDISITTPQATNSISGFAFVPKPVLITSGPVAFAAGDSVIFKAPTGANYNYAWYKNKVLIPNQNSYQYIANQSGQYKAIITVANYSVSTDSVTVTVSPSKFTLTASGPTTIAAGDSVILNATTGTGYHYTWYKDQALIPNQTSARYAATETGQYKAIIRVGSFTASTDSVNVTVSFPTKPVLKASGPVTFASGDSVTLSTVTAAGYIYTWYKNRVVIPNQTKASYIAKESGAYKVNIRSGIYTASTDSILVNVITVVKPVISASGPTMFVTGDSVILSIKPLAGYSYAWYKNNVLIPNQTKISYTVRDGGSYKAVATLGGFSASSDSVIVTVTPAIKPAITASGPTTFVNGNSVTFKVTAAAGYSYAWYRNQVLVSGQNTNSYTATLAGNYKAMVKFGNYTAYTDSVTVTVLPPPKPTLSAWGPTTFIQGDTVMLAVNVGAGYSNYNWFKNGVLIPNQTASYYTVSESGRYSALVEIGNVFKYTDSIIVNVLPPVKPVIAVSGPTTFATGDSVTLSVKPVAIYTGYAWYKNGVLVPNQTAASYVATESGNYQVMIKAGNFSILSDSVAVTTYFTLPVTNFKTSTANVTCKGQHNGSINIKAVKVLNYTATVTGDVLKAQTYAFTDHLDITNLAPGVYSLCVTVQGHPEYQQCYTLTITEPKDLAVYSAVNASGNSINLQLNGGDTYRIQLNDKIYTTTDHTINLPINNGSNKLSVTTDKLCQGEITQVINNTNNLKPYPNPFSSLLYVNLGQDVSALATIKIYRLTDGALVLQQRYLNSAGVVQLDVSSLDMGVYSFHLLLNNSESVFKINKQ